MSENQQAVTYKVLFSIFATVIIGLLGYFGTSYMAKLNQIQVDIHRLNIEVTKIQVTIITRSDIKEMIKDELEKHKIIGVKK